MKAYTLLALICLYAGSIPAQNIAKLYASPQDYLARHYDTTHTLSPKQLHDGTYELKAYKGETRHAIQNNVWAVERNDSLWVNTKLALAPQKQYIARHGGQRHHHKNYELVQYHTPNYLHFIGKRANVKNMYGLRHSYNEPAAPSLPAALAVGGVIAAANADAAKAIPPPRYNYIYIMRTGETVHLNRGNIEEYYYQALQVRDTAFGHYLVEFGKAQGYAH